MRKRRIVATAMAGLMTVATVGSLASCTGGKSGGFLKVAFSETGYGREFMEQWAAAYKEKTGTEIILEGSPNMNTEVETRLQTESNLPDVFIVLDMGWQKQAASNRLESLNDVYKAPKIYGDPTCEETIMDFMNPSIRDYGRLLDGNYYAIPWTDGPTGIIYNKTMFEKYGWDQSPDTVSDLMELCDQIYADTSYMVAPFALNAGYGGYLVDTWWAQYEGPVNYRKFFGYVNDDFDPENPDYEKHASIAGYLQKGRVEALRAFEYLFFDRDMWFTKNMTIGVDTHTMAHQHFGLQQAAMIVEGAWMQNEAKSALLKEDGTNKFEYAMMPTPFLDAAAAVGGSPKTMASQAGDFMCVPKKALNPLGAIDFLKFINSQEGCEIWSKATGGAMRPFQYKPSEIEGLSDTASDFMKSCWKVYEDSDIVYHYSTNPMQWSNKVGKWAGIDGGPYGGILAGTYHTDKEGVEITDENGELIDQAIAICNKSYAFVEDQWWEIWDSVQ